MPRCCRGALMVKIRFYSSFLLFVFFLAVEAEARNSKTQSRSIFSKFNQHLHDKQALAINLNNSVQSRCRVICRSCRNVLLVPYIVDYNSTFSLPAETLFYHFVNSSSMQVVLLLLNLGRSIR